MPECPMKVGYICPGTSAIVRECECRDCEYWKMEERKDPFLSRVKYREIGYHWNAGNHISSSIAKARVGSLPTSAEEVCKLHTPHPHPHPPTHTEGNHTLTEPIK